MAKVFDQERILKELSDDSKQALEELFNYYYPRLYNFSKAFLKLEDGIDDILQEVFIKIWDNRANIKSGYTFNSYIFTITRNLLLNELRRRLTSEKIRDQILKASVADEYFFFEKIEYDELKEKIDGLIEKLPGRQREIFKLSRIDGLSHKEISEKLNISTKTVEYHINLSIKYLQDHLKSFGLISLLYLYLFF